MGFLNHIQVLNIKIIIEINFFLIFLKKTVEKYKIKSNFMCFSVALFYNYFLCGKRAFLCGESNSSKKCQIFLVHSYTNRKALVRSIKNKLLLQKIFVKMAFLGDKF
jgi:hypothetical protein